MKINLGCGPKRTHYPGYINCDKDPKLDPDEVLDVRVKNSLGFVLPWDDNMADEIRCENLLDSLEKEEGVELIRDIWRVLRPGGKFVFHQGDVAVNPNMCFGWPFFKSPWTRYDFNYFTLNDEAHERWKKAWNLPGFVNVEIVHNDNGVMVGEMVK